MQCVKKKRKDRWGCAGASRKVWFEHFSTDVLKMSPKSFQWKETGKKTGSTKRWRSFCFNNRVSQRAVPQGGQDGLGKSLMKCCKVLIFCNFMENLVISKSHHWPLQQSSNTKTYFFGTVLVPSAPQSRQVVLAADFSQALFLCFTMQRPRCMEGWWSTLFSYKLFTTIPMQKYGDLQLGWGTWMQRTCGERLPRVFSGSQVDICLAIR